jgi:hypothetical protein
MKANVTKVQTLNHPQICEDFDSKLQEFKLKMMTQVINILTLLCCLFQVIIKSKPVTC